MMKITLWLQLPIRLVLGTTFLVTGLIKVSDPLVFAQEIAIIQIIPMSLIPFMAISLPFLEILLGSMIFSGWHLRCASFSMMLLLACYIFVLTRNLSIECHCFGTPTSGPHALIRDALLLSVAIAPYMLELGPRWRPVTRNITNKFKLFGKLSDVTRQD